jgi:putative ABC transport system substrate-binding protein
MKCRELITLLGTATAWPLAARAQQQAMPVMGFLDSRSPDGMTERVRVFRQGLKATDIVEGENVVIEYRWGRESNRSTAGAKTPKGWKFIAWQSTPQPAT